MGFCCADVSAVYKTFEVGACVHVDVGGGHRYHLHKEYHAAMAIQLLPLTTSGQSLQHFSIVCLSFLSAANGPPIDASTGGLGFNNYLGSLIGQL